MKVAGITTQQEVFVSSDVRNFRINEFLLIEDPLQGDVLGEIVQAHTFNPYIPLNVGGEVADDQMLEALRQIGYEVDQETVYVGKLRLLKEASYPIQTGSALRVPTFSEVRRFFIRTTPEEGLVLGVVKNTDVVATDMEEALKNLCNTFEDGLKQPQTGIPYLYDIRGMHQYPHVGIFGGSGSGKSYGLRVFLEELMQKRIPAIMVDPHFEMGFSDRTDSDSTFDYGGRALIVQAGRDVGVDFKEIDAVDLKNLIATSSELSDPMRNTIESVHQYKDDLASFRNRLEMLNEALELGSEDRILEKINQAESNAEREAWRNRLGVFKRFGTLPQMSVRGVLWRFNRLCKEGIFNSSTEPIETALMQGKLVVIQGSTRLLQVFATYLCNKLYKKRRDYKDSEVTGEIVEPFVPFLLCTDEAHNFAPQGMDTPSKGIFREIAQEGRKYGVFLVLATQRPSLLDNTVTAQLNTKFIFRTVRASDMQTIQEETDLSTEEIRRLPYLQSGDVFISESALGRTVFGRIRMNDTRSPHASNPFDELKELANQKFEHMKGLLLDKLPIDEGTLPGICVQLESQGKGTYKPAEITAMLEQLAQAGIVEESTNFLGLKKYKRVE